MEPFWERAYATPDASAFGPPSAEILELVPRLPAGARVLDLGCGDGRNSLVFARAGCEVTAVDRSRRGVERLRARAAEEGLVVETRIEDLSEHMPAGAYDVIVAHGVLHLLEPDRCLALIGEMQGATTRAGWNVIAVFTDRLPQPPDLAPFVLRPFREGELARLYDGWRIELFRSYVLEDEHPGGVRHRHAIDKLVARTA